MRVHHLNCGTMCPLGGPLSTGRMICHCLLVESADGLVLVDTGFGLEDVAAPRRRLGRGFLALARPQLLAAETALRQVEQRGFRADDVRHIVATHLDLDHAGGLADFPRAQVHVTVGELEAARARRDLQARHRYHVAQWAHQPAWVAHDAGAAVADRWFGFDSVQPIARVGPDLLLVPLAGHTDGHSGVAVRDERGWLLHAGDAYFHHGELADPPRCPAGLRLFQRVQQADGPARHRNRQRLRELARDHAGAVRIFCSHDPAQLAP